MYSEALLHLHDVYLHTSHFTLTNCLEVDIPKSALLPTAVFKVKPQKKIHRHGGLDESYDTVESSNTFFCDLWVLIKGWHAKKCGCGPFRVAFKPPRQRDGGVVIYQSAFWLFDLDVTTVFWLLPTCRWNVPLFHICASLCPVLTLFYRTPICRCSLPFGWASLLCLPVIFLSPWILPPFHVTHIQCERGTVREWTTRSVCSSLSPWQPRY